MSHLFWTTSFRFSQADRNKVDTSRMAYRPMRLDKVPYYIRAGSITRDTCIIQIGMFNRRATAVALHNYKTMQTMTITDFWKSLDTSGKDKVRILISRQTGCALGTVDKYGTAAVNPSAKKKEIIRKSIRKHFNIEICFPQ
mgnify:FL=1